MHLKEKISTTKNKKRLVKCKNIQNMQTMQIYNYIYNHLSGKEKHRIKLDVFNDLNMRLNLRDSLETIIKTNV